MIDLSAGILLVADPFLKDPNFMRTVVLICEHNEDGSFGFVINRSYEYKLSELIEDAAGIEVPVYYGGPVQMNTIHFLHQYPEKIEGGIMVGEGIYWGGNFANALNYIKNGEIDPGNLRFFIGYSGWSQGQLEDECKENSWLTVKAIRKIVFHNDTSEIWKDSLRHMGGKYEMMINFPIDPQLN